MSKGFDFLHGTWNVTNRRLLHPLTGSDEWDEFPATSTCRPFFGGNVDEVVFTSKGSAGLTLRTWDVEREQWAIYWISSRDGVLQAPVFGDFVSDSEGEFYGWDEFEGRRVKVSYLWSVHSPDSATWRQGFSVDDGETWEINWVMELSR